MNAAAEEFHREVIREHIDEVSAFRGQWLSALNQLEMNWRDTDYLGVTLECRIDALVVGGDLALEICQSQALEGEGGELYAATLVFCRSNRLDLVRELLAELDVEDAEKATAVTDALIQEAPVIWEGEIFRVLSERNPALLGVFARVAGWRRSIVAGELLQTIDPVDSTTLAQVAWSFGRLPKSEIRVQSLNQWLRHRNPQVRSVAGLALLRLGQANVVSYCFDQLRTSDCPCLMLGLAGGPSSSSALRDVASRKALASDCLLALGLLGEASSIELLLEFLESDQMAKSTARSLNLITGAGVSEKVFLPDADEEGPIGEESFKSGKQEPSGDWVTQLSTSPDTWRKWWSDNKARFEPGVRYRNGKLSSPATLLETLEGDASPRQLRQLAYEELVIRYGIDFPFETDMFVSQQEKALEKYREWNAANADRFQPGQWYFAGRIMGT